MLKSNMHINQQRIKNNIYNMRKSYIWGENTNGKWLDIQQSVKMVISKYQKDSFIFIPYVLLYFQF